MREYGVSEQEACIELKKQVESAWKDINHELMFSETSKFQCWFLCEVSILQG
ncbi:hypothetical protein Goklo_024614 [Gossypium klotzschianum]|uniref:Terpene synthase metal-binding domain-containing protein n=1 Tax=Gossypium klotzschianum TaxID=34286 RepID=A0A7J8W5Y1_9ROSI|nr:hypothetical protein [Gossypium klotzschianum]